jgi:hypothetical protein
MAAQDIAKTAIITPFGLFGYLFMPFGLRNAAQTFQRFLDSLLKHLPFVFRYLDDIIIASHSPKEHHEHLRQIFTIHHENGLQINSAKRFRRRHRRGVPGTPGGPGRRSAAPATRTYHQ